VSAPLPDRVDLHVNVPRVPVAGLAEDGSVTVVWIVHGAEAGVERSRLGELYS
jgi:hypothetical protein